MHLHAIGQNRRVVAAFQDADQLAAGVGVGHVEHESRERNEIFGLQAEVADRIEPVAVEAGSKSTSCGLILAANFSRLLRKMSR